MDFVFVASGTGYQDCTAFDGYEVIANPLGEWSEADRESRVFGRDGRGYGGVTYASHCIKLAKREYCRDLYILMEHGAGREVWRIPAFYDGGALQEHILTMPPRLQYALIYSMHKMASTAKRQAEEETRAIWAQAYADGRLKKHRANRHRGAWVEVLPVKEIAG